jgi:hypothetical protein
MPIPKFKPVANASEGTKKIIKPILVALLAILAGAFGLEATNNDWDLGKILKGNSPSDSKILRDQNGNIRRDASGQIITRVMRDKNGNVVPDGTAGAKYTDEYNCADFSTQPESQAFFDKAGGVTKDTNRLDGDKDGVACEDLPKGARR